MNNKGRSYFYVAYTFVNVNGNGNGYCFMSCDGEMFSIPDVINSISENIGVLDTRIVILNWIRFDNEAQSLAAQGKSGPTPGAFLRVVK